MKNTSVKATFYGAPITFSFYLDESGIGVKHQKIVFCRALPILTLSRQLLDMYFNK